jgi:hypothetical protein
MAVQSDRVSVLRHERSKTAATTLEKRGSAKPVITAGTEKHQIKQNNNDNIIIIKKLSNEYHKKN